MTPINSLAALFDTYDVFLCDVWGVLHNGVEAFPHAVKILGEARAAGKTVVLITNSPRPSDGVILQLDALNIPRDTYDRIVTSGDVTRDLIASGPRKVFLLGPDRDLPLFAGLDVDLVSESDAETIVCTGLFDDESEVPEDYADMLTKFHARGLPMICANPDIVVERGDRLIWCAGSLARDYAAMGGKTLIAGKPHAPIYRASLKAAQSVTQKPLDTARILAIGDGMPTDVKGAQDAGLDLLYISGGIHARDYAAKNGPDWNILTAFLDKHGATPVATMPRLA